MQMLPMYMGSMYRTSGGRGDPFGGASAQLRRSFAGASPDLPDETFDSMTFESFSRPMTLSRRNRPGSDRPDASLYMF